MNRPYRAIGIVVAIGCTVFAGVLAAQAPGLTRTILQKADASIAGYEEIVARIEVAAGGVAGWHTHPGDEIDYVTEGEGELLIAGQPPRKVVAGDAFIIPAGTPHNARNTGSVPIKVVGVFIVEKGKPMASPAPAPAQ